MYVTVYTCLNKTKSLFLISILFSELEHKYATLHMTNNTYVPQTYGTGE